MEAAVAATEALSLAAYRDEVAGCTKCPLSKGRTQVVFGSGSPTAELMFVGEAPGFHEDKQGVPFVGAAGQLLGKLLAGIGMSREEVFVANVLKCLRYTALVQLGDGSWERITPKKSERRRPAQAFFMRRRDRARRLARPV